MMKMNRRNLALPLLLLFVSACANDPYDSAEEINEACSFEMQAALTAIKLRDKQKPKSLLLTKLSPLDKDSSRLLVNMYQVVDEVYAYTWLNETVYSTYRFELCQRQLLYKPYPLSIEPVLPGLKHCQQQYGTTSSEQSTRCVTNTFNKHQNQTPRDNQGSKGET